MEFTIQDLGAIGEFLGACAVVTTLIYLSIQMRQNTKTLKSSIYTSWVETASHTHEMISNNIELYASIFDKSRTGEKFTTAEQIAAEIWCTHVFNGLEAAYLHHLEGLLDPSVFEAKQRNAIRQFRLPMTRKFWSDVAPDIYDQRFIVWIETEVIPAIDT